MTHKPRPDLGFGAALGDLGDFAPKAKQAPKLDTRQAAEDAGFKSREAKAEKPKKPQRRRRTGRNAQFNIKARPETIEAFYKVADANGWGLGETLEHAVALLEKQHLNRKE
ncbi:stability/partitioning determinant [Oceaniglobus ichthyenteri]|uniref:stability/partitioning determinant n=1 Tax=Oceaniglobus ichthyenteri TaxID=2136177 RepID=UPI000D3C3D22|nr:stability/partitioning determinant [Oceaniglobus ichthyenteri]